MTAGTGNDDFVSLWPTIVLRRIIPGHEEANLALVDLITEREQATPDMTTEYLREEFLSLDHAVITWLKECINITVVDYFRHLGMDYELNWTLQGWPNVNRFGDYHDCHNHPRAYLSGTYYVQIPERAEDLHVRKDVRPGRITLYDPRGAVNMTAIRGDPNIEAEFTVDPCPGMILLWPAFINHFVHPNLSRDPRISVSFNVMLQWSEDHIPDQV